MNHVKLFVVGNNGGQPDLVQFLPSSLECHEILHGQIIIYKSVDKKAHC